MGKVLLEKLLRTCHGIEAIYLLVRPKKDKDIHTRINELFDDLVRHPAPHIFNFFTNFIHAAIRKTQRKRAKIQTQADPNQWRLHTSWPRDKYQRQTDIAHKGEYCHTCGGHCTI